MIKPTTIAGPTVIWDLRGRKQFELKATLKHIKNSVNIGEYKR